MNLDRANVFLNLDRANVFLTSVCLSVSSPLSGEEAAKESQQEQDCWSRWCQSKSPESLCGPVMWDSTEPLQHQPEQGEGPGAVEDILSCPSTKKISSIFS